MCLLNKQLVYLEVHQLRLRVLKYCVTAVSVQLVLPKAIDILDLNLYVGSHSIFIYKDNTK